jgi:hypothetical protein
MMMRRTWQSLRCGVKSPTRIRVARLSKTRNYVLSTLLHKLSTTKLIKTVVQFLFNSDRSKESSFIHQNCPLTPESVLGSLVVRNLLYPPSVVAQLCVAVVTCERARLAPPTTCISVVRHIKGVCFTSCGCSVPGIEVAKTSRNYSSLLRPSPTDY